MRSQVLCRAAYWAAHYVMHNIKNVWICPYAALAESHLARLEGLRMLFLAG